MLNDEKEVLVNMSGVLINSAHALRLSSFFNCGRFAELRYELPAGSFVLYKDLLGGKECMSIAQEVADKTGKNVLYKGDNTQTVFMPKQGADEASLSMEMTG